MNFVIRGDIDDYCINNGDFFTIVDGFNYLWGLAHYKKKKSNHENIFSDLISHPKEVSLDGTYDDNGKFFRDANYFYMLGETKLCAVKLTEDVLYEMNKPPKLKKNQKVDMKIKKIIAGENIIDKCISCLEIFYGITINKNEFRKELTAIKLDEEKPTDIKMIMGEEIGYKTKKFNYANEIIYVPIKTVTNIFPPHDPKPDFSSYVITNDNIKKTTHPSLPFVIDLNNILIKQRYAIKNFSSIHDEDRKIFDSILNRYGDLTCNYIFRFSGFLHYAKKHNAIGSDYNEALYKKLQKYVYVYDDKNIDYYDDLIDDICKIKFDRMLNGISGSDRVYGDRYMFIKNHVYKNNYNISPNEKIHKDVIKCFAQLFSKDHDIFSKPFGTFDNPANTFTISEMKLNETSIERENGPNSPTEFGFDECINIIIQTANGHIRDLSKVWKNLITCFIATGDEENKYNENNSAMKIGNKRYRCINKHFFELELNKNMLKPHLDKLLTKMNDHDIDLEHLAFIIYRFNIFGYSIEVAPLINKMSKVIMYTTDNKKKVLMQMLIDLLNEIYSGYVTILDDYFGDDFMKTVIAYYLNTFGIGINKKFLEADKALPEKKTVKFKVTQEQFDFSGGYKLYADNKKIEITTREYKNTMFVNTYENKKILCMVEVEKWSPGMRKNLLPVDIIKNFEFDDKFNAKPLDRCKFNFNITYDEYFKNDVGRLIFGEYHINLKKKFNIDNDVCFFTNDSELHVYYLDLGVKFVFSNDYDFKFIDGDDIYERVMDNTWTKYIDNSFVITKEKKKYLLVISGSAPEKNNEKYLKNLTFNVSSSEPNDIIKNDIILIEIKENNMLNITDHKHFLTYFYYWYANISYENKNYMLNMFYHVHNIYSVSSGYIKNLVEYPSPFVKFIYNMFVGPTDVSGLAKKVRAFNRFTNEKFITPSFDFLDTVEELPPGEKGHKKNMCGLSPDKIMGGGDYYDVFYDEGMLGKMLSPIKTAIPYKKNKFKFIIMIYEYVSCKKVKADQYILIKKILCDLEKNKNRYYQLIMGAGKTSFIIPVVSLCTLFYGMCKRFFVVQPNSLVDQTFMIFLNNVAPICPWKIKKTLQGLDDKECIYIISDSELKKYFLNGGQKFDSDSIFIFDEIDQIADNCKCEMNIQSGLPTKIPNLNHRVKYIFDRLNNKPVTGAEKHIDEKIIPIVKERVFSLHYGIDYENKKFAVPFIAIDTPSKVSEYSDVDFCIAYTLLSVKKHMPQSLVKDIVTVLVKEYQKFKRPRLIDFYNNFIKEPRTDFLMLNRSFVDSITFETNDISDELIIFYVVSVINDHFKYYKQVKNISFIDIFSENCTTRKSGVTGTPFVTGLIDRSGKEHVCDLIMQKDANDKIIKNMRNTTVWPNVEDKISGALENIEDALIDVGAYLLGKSVIDFVRLIYDKVRKPVIYIDSSNKVMCYDGTKSLPFKNNKTYDDYKKGDKSPYFYFFDQAHITGVDIIIPYEISAIVTVSKYNRYTEIAQGIYRLRKIGEYHEFYYTCEGDFGPDEIVNNAIENEIKYFKSMKYYYYQQLFRMYKKYETKPANYEIEINTGNDFDFTPFKDHPLYNEAVAYYGVEKKLYDEMQLENENEQEQEQEQESRNEDGEKKDDMEFWIIKKETDKLTYGNDDIVAGIDILKRETYHKAEYKKFFSYGDYYITPLFIKCIERNHGEYNFYETKYSGIKYILYITEAIHMQNQGLIINLLSGKLLSIYKFMIQSKTFNATDVINLKNKVKLKDAPAIMNYFPLYSDDLGEFRKCYGLENCTDDEIREFLAEKK